MSRLTQSKPLSPVQAHRTHFSRRGSDQVAAARIERGAVFSDLSGTATLLTLPQNPAYRVELWHDTSNWNEEFEDAREARGSVHVATGAVADAVVAVVRSGKCAPPSGDGFIACVAESHAGHDTYDPAQADLLFSALGATSDGS